MEKKKIEINHGDHLHIESELLSCHALCENWVWLSEIHST